MDDTNFMNKKDYEQAMEEMHTYFANINATEVGQLKRQISRLKAEINMLWSAINLSKTFLEDGKAKQTKDMLCEIISIERKK